jgi:hypothetical protein
VGGFVPSPLVVVFNKFIRRSRDNGRFGISFSFRTLGTEVDFLKVVEFGFIEVRQVPEKADVFKAEVVPFIVVWVVRYFILMYVLSFSPHSGHADELTRVTFVRSASLVTVLGGDPATVNDDSSSFNLDGVSSLECLFEGKFTSFVTVKRVDHIKSISSVLLAGDEYFFTDI